MPSVLIDFVPLLQFDVAQCAIDIIRCLLTILFQGLIVAMDRIVVFLLEKMFVA